VGAKMPKLNQIVHGFRDRDMSMVLPLLRSYMADFWRISSNMARNDESTNEQLVYNVGGGSMVVIAHEPPHAHEEEADMSTSRRRRSQAGIAGAHKK